MRDGALGSVVRLAYLLPPLAVLLATVGRAAVEGLPAGGPPASFVVASTLSLPTAATVAYLLPAALVGLSREELRAAFAPRELLAAVTNGRYFHAWVVGGATLGTAAALAPGLNRVALGFFLFYAVVVAAAAGAEGVGETVLHRLRDTASMLEAALRYPLKSDDRVATLIIGGLLLVLSVLVLPVFVLQGYLVRVLDSSARGETEAPSFTDWGGLFVDGLKLTVVNVVVGVVVAVPFLAVTALFTGGLFAVGDSAGGVTALGAVGALVFVLLSVFALVVSYFLPAMFANFAVEGRLGAAFDLRTVRSVAFTTDYLVAVLLAVVLGSVINTVAAPFALLLVGIPMLFYGQVVTYYLFGRAYAEGRRAAGLSGFRDGASTSARSGGV